MKSDNAKEPFADNISFKVGDAPKNVIENRKQLLAALEERGLQGWHECSQIHGDMIIKTDMPGDPFANPDNLQKADGMMTNKRGLGLMIKTADCQPVFVTDMSGKNIMALHVGWRGNRISFPVKAIRKFCAEYNLEPENLLAVRGPSLGPASAKFVNFEDEWGEHWKKWFNTETACMDLWSLTKSQLTDFGKNGMSPKNIFGIDICTLLNNDSFFSYRNNKITGRQANFVWMA